MGEQNTQDKGQKNSVDLVGNLGGNPKLGKTQRDKPYATFTLGNNPSLRQKAIWSRIIVWDKALISIAEGFSKGDEVEVNGSLQNSWPQDEQAVNRQSLPVVKAEELRLIKSKATSSDN